MANKTLKVRFQQKTDTYNNWVTNNPVLLDGEIAIVEIPSGTGVVAQEPATLIKIGDGSSHFSSLPFSGASAADVYSWAKEKNPPSSVANADKAEALTTSAGSATQPVYFSNGKPVKCTYTLGKSVPSNAVFTDTTYSPATSSTGGLMSSLDKEKLDGIDEGAQVNSITGVKGGAESSYRTGNVNITAANVGAIATTARGAVNGVASLGSDGKVPSSQLPSYVDDVIEGTLTNDTTFTPTNGTIGWTGETGKIYVDTTTGKTYRWSGTAYVEISASLALGETSSTAFAGDKGKQAYTHAVTNKGAAFSSGLYKITTNSEGHVINAIAVAKSDITGLGIPAQDTVYTLPSATSSVLGGVKVGSNITVSSGTISLTKANVTAALGYTPPTTNTTYSVMTGATASAAGAQGLVPAPASGKQTSFLRGDGTWVVPTNTTYSAATTSTAGLMSAADKTKLDGIATGANNYSLPNATASVLGGVKIGSNITVSSGTISLTKANVTAALGYTPPTTNTTYSVVSTSANGLAPKLSGTATTFLNGSGSYTIPSIESLGQTNYIILNCGTSSTVI